MEEVLNTVYEYLATWGLKVVAALVILIVGKIAAKIIANLAEKAAVKAKVDETLAKFARHVCYATLMVVVIIAVLGKLGVQTTSFITVIGVTGLAVGLALQGSLSNLAAGFLMIMLKPFKVGDFVEAAGENGTVEEIQILNTILKTLDNVKVIVPNSKITSENIRNYTANGIRRVDLVIGVSYEDDLKKAKEVMEGVLNRAEKVLDEPVPTVAVCELGDSSVNFVVRPWVNSADYWDVYFDVTTKVKIALDENGISIPFPQRDVHIKNGSAGQVA